MKVVLYYPPLVVASVKNPYPSLAILSSYLKENCNHEVLVKDINVDFINNLVNISENNVQDNISDYYLLKHARSIRNKLSFIFSITMDDFLPTMIQSGTFLTGFQNGRSHGRTS